MSDKTDNSDYYKEIFDQNDPEIEKQVNVWVDEFNKIHQPKYIIIREDGKEVYRDQEDNMIILTDYEYACNMIGMLEVNGYVCEIKYHHKEEE